MRSQSPFIPFHPELFQVKSQRQKEQLRAYVLLSACEKATESEVIFQQAERTFNLDRPTQAQMNAKF